MCVQGVTGIGKSAFTKRQGVGLIARGVIPLILGTTHWPRPSGAEGSPRRRRR